MDPFDVVDDNKAARYRYWGVVFDDPEWTPPQKLPEHARAMCGQLEMAKRLHWQMYTQWKKPMSAKQVSESMGLPWYKSGEAIKYPCNMKPCPKRASPEQCMMYSVSETYNHETHTGSHKVEGGVVVENPEWVENPTMKEEFTTIKGKDGREFQRKNYHVKGRSSEPFALGEFNLEGHETGGGGAKHGRKGGAAQQVEFQEAVAKLKQGISIEQVAMEHPETYIRFCNGMTKLAQIHAPQKNWKPALVWLSGPTECEKSHCATTVVKNYWPHPGGEKAWFDGYAGHEVVVMNDFRKSWFKFDYWLRLIDHGPLLVPVKGGFVQWRPRVVIVTTPQPVREMYDTYVVDGATCVREDAKQLYRRVTWSCHFPVENWREARNAIRRILVEARTYNDESDDEWDGVTAPERVISVDRSRSPRRSQSAQKYDPTGVLAGIL